MIILGIDLETTGLDPKEERITEIGAVLWDTSLNCPIKFFNELVDPEKQISSEITALTGITNELIAAHSISESVAIPALLPLMDRADFFMAHNAKFDKGFLEASAARVGVNLQDKIWIDSSTDVAYPESISTRKLVHLAAEHKFVNPFAHRAVTDVLTMMQIVSQYNWDEVLLNANTPNVVLRAHVQFHDKEKAKGMGYRWDGDSKVWLKTVKASQVQKEKDRAEKLGFPIGEWHG